MRLPFLSQTAEHALRAVLYLAGRDRPELVSAKEMADALGAPHNYLGKTLRRLSQQGLLKSVRGPRGGFGLALDPAEISTADVLDAVDEPRPTLTCLMGDRSCDPAQPCEVHHQWAKLADRVVAPLRGTTIADLRADTGTRTLHPRRGTGRPEVTRP